MHFKLKTNILSFVIILFALFSMPVHGQNSKTQNCFNTQNFDLSLKYIKWKHSVSKIGKVLIDGYELEISDTKEILFKDKGYTLFKVNKEKGIILLPVKQTKKIQINSNKSFCELVKYANISSNNYK